MWNRDSNVILVRTTLLVCVILVKVEKYFYMIYIFYRIIFIREKPLSVGHFTSSLFSSGMIQFYKFSKRIEKSNAIKLGVGHVNEILLRGLMMPDNPEEFVTQILDPRVAKHLLSYYYTFLCLHYVYIESY